MEVPEYPGFRSSEKRTEILFALLKLKQTMALLGVTKHFSTNSQDFPGDNRLKVWTLNSKTSLSLPKIVFTFYIEN